MQHSLVFTFICNDKPGIVDQLSTLVAAQGGSWQESRMAKMAGKFTGIVQVSVGEKQLPALKNHLLQLAGKDFSILVDDVTPETASRPSQQLQLAIIGLDRPGIVREVAQALAQNNINVTRMHSVIESAPMTGEPLFKADVDVEAPLDIDLDTLNDRLDTICSQLDIDLSLSRNYRRNGNAA